jgi:hypothetical protein
MSVADGKDTRGRKDFEYLEFVIVGAITLTLTLFDLQLILMSSDHEKPAKIVHDVFQGFLLSLVATSCTAMVIRWYRHRDEILDAVESFKKLNKYKDVELRISNIIRFCLDIREKNWPRHANDILIEELESLRAFVQRLYSGRVNLSYEVAIEHSPKFFTTAKGLIFVTSYGEWKYWKSEAGKKQLESNKEAISRFHRKIIRVFILPPYDGIDSKIPEDFAPVIEEQLNAGVEVRAVFERNLPAKFRRDVGVFFHDKEKKSSSSQSGSPTGRSKDTVTPSGFSRATICGFTSKCLL